MCVHTEFIKILTKQRTNEKQKPKEKKKLKKNARKWCNCEKKIVDNNSNSNNKNKKNIYAGIFANCMIMHPKFEQRDDDADKMQREDEHEGEEEEEAKKNG